MIRFFKILYLTAYLTLSCSYMTFAFQAQSILLSNNNPQIIDSWHYSHTFGEIRKFRVFLPTGYSNESNERYPVIYFFHGWSQRYFGPVGDDYSNYDKGDENKGDNILNYVSKNKVIIVKLDGFNGYSNINYDLSPYNIGSVDSHRQFPIYFPEFVAYFDNNYKTIPDREHRAVAGLSMGGFISFFISAKYPHLISTVGNFCGSPEFIIGPMEFPVEYCNRDMYDNYSGVNVRFHYGDKDNLRPYHRDMNKIWSQVMDNYEYKIYDAAHTTCGLGEMFDFMLNTFRDPPKKPEKWDHIDVYPEFSVWDYQIYSDRFRPGYTILENVDKRGFKCSIRTFLPNGEFMPYVNMIISTPPIYKKNQEYTINDIDTKGRNSSQWTIKSDQKGSLKIHIDGGLHHIGINKANDLPNLSVASVDIENMSWPINKKDVILSVRILNKGLTPAEGVKIKLFTTKEGALVKEIEGLIDRIDVNEVVESQNTFTFHADLEGVEIYRLLVRVIDKNGNEWSEYVDVKLRDEQSVTEDFVIADGKEFIVSKAGIDSVKLFVGKGNGDGIANPGESIVILAKDRGKYWRTELISSDPNLNPFGVSLRTSDNWSSYDHVNGSAKISMPVIASDCPEHHVIEFLAEYWLPENRDHIITRKKINIEVSGRDKTPPVLNWVDVSADNTIQARIYDGSRIKKVIARYLPVFDVKGLDYVDLKDPKRNLEMALHDDGRNGDRKSDDFVFSHKIPEQSMFFYRIEIESTDLHGNTGTERYPEVFIVY